MIIHISAGVLRTRGTQVWVGNLCLRRKGHIEFVFNFIPRYLGILVWINWEVRR
jgi:hypothetical protein